MTHRTAKITTIAASLALSLFSVQAAPVIAKGGIYNNASYAGDGALNRGIAQGSVFAIFGTGLGPDALQQVGSYPLPKDLGGATVRVTPQFGSPIDAYPLYVTAGQIGVLLPDSVPTGLADVTVAYQGQTSRPEQITVVRRSVGVFTANQAGSGPAIVQNFNSASDQPINTLTTPAKPGQTVILWATGLGAVSADETAAPAPGDIAAGVTVYVGGVAAPIRYAGRSGCCSGIDQIVFDIPNNVQGCYVPIHIVGRGVFSTPENRTIPAEHTVSNSVTISVASSGQCVDSSGLTAADLTAMQSKGGRVGALSFTRRPAGLLENTQDDAGGQFSRFDAASFLRSRGIFGLPAFGTCVQYQVGRDLLDSPDPIRGALLDAGASLTVAGPAGSRDIPRGALGDYAVPLGGARESGGSSPSFLAAGDYTLTGRGGADVGAFDARFTVPAAPTWVNRDPVALANSFQPNLQWSLSGPATYMLLATYGRNDLTGFETVCVADPAKGAFTIPGYVYAAIIQHTTAVPGVLWMGAGSIARFTAPGLDFGLINSVIATQGVFIP